jgi:hypothetical protein
VIFLCCRAATIAASMAVLGSGSDRPAAVRPAALAEDGGRRLFCPARNAASRGPPGSETMTKQFSDGPAEAAPSDNRVILLSNARTDR